MALFGLNGDQWYQPALAGVHVCDIPGLDQHAPRHGNDCRPAHARRKGVCESRKLKMHIALEADTAILRCSFCNLRNLTDRLDRRLPPPVIKGIFSLIDGGAPGEPQSKERCTDPRQGPHTRTVAAPFSASGHGRRCRGRRREQWDACLHTPRPPVAASYGKCRSDSRFRPRWISPGAAHPRFRRSRHGR